MKKLIQWLRDTQMSDEAFHYVLYLLLGAAIFFYSLLLLGRI